MAYFRCLLRGEGLLGILNGRDGPIGFYVNRPVEADDAEQARRAVLDAFHAELAERGWADKGGRVVVDEIDEIDASELSSIGQGFVVFPDEEDGCAPQTPGHVAPTRTLAADEKRRIKTITVASVLSVLTVLALIHSATALSVPGPEAQLMHRASQACVIASGLRRPVVNNTIDFRDIVLVIIDDGYPQPNADRPPAQFACLFDKRTDAVEIKPLSR